MPEALLRHFLFGHFYHGIFYHGIFYLGRLYSSMLDSGILALQCCVRYGTTEPLPFKWLRVTE
jgi:hypothetical protein